MRRAKARRSGSKKKKCAPGKVPVYSKALGRSRCFSRELILKRQRKRK
tara:strand:+ start:96 stop:239 length:144 start_codon:yes stop_codon:yes gene_type:complete